MSDVSTISAQTFANAGFTGYVLPSGNPALFRRSLEQEGLPACLVDAYMDMAAQIGVRRAAQVRRQCREFAAGAYVAEERKEC